MSEECILALDQGTQSVRAILFDLQGRELAKSQIIIEPYYSAQPGWAEQDPAYFWERLCHCCQQLWEKSPVPKEAIRGVTLTTQRATIVTVDREGQPLRPAISWLDQRLTQGLPPVGGPWGLAFKLLRMEADIARIQAEAESNWIRRNQPDLWAKTHKYLLLSGYLTYKLTGRFVDSTGNQVGYLPFDVKRMGWAASWDWRWQALNLEPKLLSELVLPAATLGQISGPAADATGIPAGLPLVAAAGDKACEVLGLGSLEPQIGCLGYGTAAIFNTTQSKYLEVVPPLPPYPAAVPGYYNPEISVNRGFWMVSWFKKEFAHYERQLAEERGIETEQLFDELVEQVPPGSLGLILQPYWMPSFKLLEPEAKGAIIGFGEVHTRAHLYRAILEGIAYALREGLERSEKRSGIPIKELRVAGGGSRSNAALQLTADLFGLPASRSHTYETSALGAAIDAAVGLKLHPNFEAAVQEMVRIEDTFMPDYKAHEIYEQLYRRVYLPMYDKLQPLYREIQKITGYP